MTPLTELKNLAVLQGDSKEVYGATAYCNFITAICKTDLTALVAYVESLQNDIGKLVIQRESLKDEKNSLLKTLNGIVRLLDSADKFSSLNFMINAIKQEVEAANEKALEGME